MAHYRHSSAAASALALSVLAAAGAEAAPMTLACPDIFGADRLVIDPDLGRAQLVGDNLIRRSPNYALTLGASQRPNLVYVIPPPNAGGGTFLPGTEPTQFRFETQSGNFVSEEYASERVLGTCGPVEPIPFLEVRIPSPSDAGRLGLACTPFDMTAPAPEAWTPLPADTFRLVFDAAGNKVLRQDAASATPVEHGLWFKDDGQKIAFSIEATTNAGGFALNRYSGNLFETTDLAYSPGRLIATCEPED